MSYENPNDEMNCNDPGKTLVCLSFVSILGALVVLAWIVKGVG